MNNFFSGVINEWKQHWRLLLALFAANMFFLELNIIGYREFAFWWSSHKYIFFFILSVFDCSIPVAMAPSLREKSKSPSKTQIRYQSKLTKFLVPLWRILFLSLPFAGFYILRMDMRQCSKWWNNGPFDLFLPFFFFAVLILLCISFFAFRQKTLIPRGPGMSYWIKFLAAWLQFMFFAMFTFAIYNTSSCDFIYYSFSFIPLIVATGVYVLVFFVSIMMPKLHRAIVFIITIPLGFLLYFLLAPGILGFVALLSTDCFLTNIIIRGYNFCYEVFGKPLIVFSYISIVPLWVFITSMPPGGYFLWTKKIVVRKNYFRLLVMTTALLAIFSFVLNVFAEYTVRSKLRQAISEARSLGLIYGPEDILSASTPVPAKRNAARLYRQAFKVFEKLDRDGIYYICPSGIYGDSLDYLRTATLPKEEKKLLTLIKSPEWQQTNLLIKQATSLPECRFIPQITKYRINLFGREGGCLGYFILTQADIYRRTGQYDKILPEIERCVLLAERINNEKLRNSFSTSRILMDYAIVNAIKSGPENSSAANAYRRIFACLERTPVNYINNPLEFPYTSSVKEVQYANLFIGYPLFVLILTDHINNSIKTRRKMLKLSKLPVLPSKADRQTVNDYFNSLDYALRTLFVARSTQAMLKIGLALKIYKCENGKYPADLRKLTPAILPLIPVDPLDGKAFGYKLKNGNFTLTRNLNYNHTLSSKLSMSD